MGAVTLEAVCNPVVDFFVLPTDERNPWAVRLPSAALPYTIDLESGMPEKRIRNMEFGGRLTVNLSGVDFSLSALRTWNKMPALCPTLSADRQSLRINGEYRRMTMLGADCSLPVGQDRKSTRLNSSHANISYAVFCLKKKKNIKNSFYN